MRILLTCLAISLGAVAAQAQTALPTCEAMWIERNLIFHRAGHCFGSALGKDLFGNAGCTTQNAVLPPLDRAAVEQIRHVESRFGCKVATGWAATGAMRAHLARMSVFADIPASDELGWACLGYTGPGFALHAGTDSRHRITGHVQPGHFVYSEYYPRAGWVFLVSTTGPGGRTLAEGWSNTRITSAQCLSEAG